jgi:hypothetical protein
MVDLSDLGRPGDDIVRAIDDAVEAVHDEEERVYLGASVIGDACERKLWYGFRWAHEPERFSGRMLRLFDTGHHEEARMIAWMRMAGMTVTDRDPETREQLAISAIGGHFRGHLDGEATGVPTAPVTVHAVEIKTHSSKSFAELKKHGVEAAKPMHAAQMQAYMDRRGRTRALYLAKNKDTDELYAERLKADPAAAARLLARAERIITADVPPIKIRDSADEYPCRFCPAAAVCHDGKPARRNCRTCLHSTPVMDGAGGWKCEKFGRPLTADEQRAGCSHHRFLPGLVDGEIVDADEADETVTYRMRDGSAWIDGR